MNVQKLTRTALALAAVGIGGCGGSTGSKNPVADAAADTAAPSVKQDGAAPADGASSMTGTDAGSDGASGKDATADGAVAGDATAPLMGPGASLKCKSSNKNAWETYGVNAFVAVNEAIVANVAAEVTANNTKNIGGSFAPVLAGARPDFKGNLAAFLVWAYGGPAEITYTDNKKHVGPQDMAQKHLGLNITSSQYDYFVVSLVVPALTAKGVPVDDVSSCFAPVLTDLTFKAQIVGNGTGPGAALKCESSGKNAFETYGAANFVKVNEQIFTNVFAEIGANDTANLGSSFKSVTPARLPIFKGNLAAFLVYAYGGPREIAYTDGNMYVGPQDMAQAHAGLGITNAQYGYFLTNVVVPALTKVGVKNGAGGAADPNDVSSCFAPILLDAGFQASIVGK